MKKKDFLDGWLQISDNSEHPLAGKEIPVLQCRQTSLVWRIKSIQMGQCMINLPQQLLGRDAQECTRRVVIFSKQKN